MSTVGIIALGTVAAIEGLAAVDRDRQRESLYYQALQKSAQTGRLFVVVGAPGGGSTRGVGCGDICIDINDCKGCPISVAHDLTSGPIQDVPDDSAVVYVSCVLEYVSNYQKAWEEIIRMAGSVDNIFVVNVQPWTLTAALYPDAKQTISPVDVIGEFRPEYVADSISTTRKVLSFGAILGLLIWAIVPSK